MIERRRMQFGDWLNGAALFAVGVFVGLAIGEWLSLEGAAFWLTAVYVIAPLGLVFLFTVFLEKVTDRIFPSGVKASPSGRQKTRTPRALLAAFPTGLAVGAIGAQLGLSEILLTSI